MEISKEILSNLKDSGKDIGIYSKTFSTYMYDYNPLSFSNFSARSYYYWIKNKRPIPTSIILKIMNDKKIDKISIDYLSISGGNKIIPPDENNIYFYYILGLIAGDGCLVHAKRGLKNNTYSIRISFQYIGEARLIKKIVDNMFNINSSIYFSSGCYALCIYSKPLVLILNKKYDLPLGLKYSLLKVPDIVFQNNERARAFIKGVFDSDGNIYIHRSSMAVQIRQKSINFLKELRDLLNKLNVNFREPYYDKANNSWVLWSSKKELVDNFINKIIEFKPRCGPIAQPG